MQIPEQILTKWADLKSEGDPGKILEAYTEKHGTVLHVETIRLAIRTGNASDEVFEVIADFYEAKLKSLEKYMTPATTTA